MKAILLFVSSFFIVTSFGSRVDSQDLQRAANSGTTLSWVLALNPSGNNIDRAMGFYLGNLGFDAEAGSDNNVRIGVEPKNVLIEKKRNSQYVSFDFRIENPSQRTIRLSRIEMSVFDRSGILLLRKFLTASGLSHSDFRIAVIEPKAAIFLFNPFDSFEPDVELTTLKYDFTFETDDRSIKFTSSVEVKPLPHIPKTRLELPLKGRMIVYDGHDTYAHHRRFSLADPFLQEIGVMKNFTRFASDLCVVNAQGELRRNTSLSNTDWYGFGAKVFAPGAGVVIKIRKDVPDNVDGKSSLTLDDFRKDPFAPAGNFVMIDHRNGEYSLLAHFKKESIIVKQGDSVRVGQPIGEIGLSGDAYLPHIHYELRDAGGLNADGLPAVFADFFRVTSGRRVQVTRSPIDSGDILESR